MLRKLIYTLYNRFFINKFFYRFNRFAYGLSLRGMGILNFGTHHPSDEENFITSHITGLDKPTIFDVGANRGDYSKILRGAHNSADIFSFEPHPKTYQKLVSNLEGLNIRTFNVGLGSKSGVLKLYDYLDHDASEHASLYKGVIEDIHKGKVVEHEVVMSTLEEFVADHGITRVHLLKIDTEGHELEVMKGFDGFIKANKVDLIHFEFNEMNVVSRVFFKDFWDLLPNYDFYRMLPDGLVPIKYYSPIYCEIFAYQNIVAKLKVEFHGKNEA